MQNRKRNDARASLGAGNKKRSSYSSRGPSGGRRSETEKRSNNTGDMRHASRSTVSKNTKTKGARNVRREMRDRKRERQREKRNLMFRGAFSIVLLVFVVFLGIHLVNIAQENKDDKNRLNGGAVHAAGTVQTSQNDETSQEEPVSAEKTENHGEDVGPEYIPPEEIVIDDPLLLLVNNDNEIPDDYEVTPRLISGMTVDIKMYDDLVRMMDDAYSNGASLWIASAYRDVETQERLLEQDIRKYENWGYDREEAEERAQNMIALPGCSEHHTGLVVDFNTVTFDFEYTKEYAWLTEYAAEYGFIQRYTKEKEDITGIGEEVWHYRYVGEKHAKRIKNLGVCLEEYIEMIKSGEIPLNSNTDE